MLGKLKMVKEALLKKGAAKETFVKEGTFEKKETIFSPLGIFIMYILASSLVIMGFRFIYAGEAVPLSYFSFSWRLIRGALDVLDIFPALALSALVIPFGFKIRPRETINPFSPHFLQSLKTSIITAIAAAAVYALLFSLALPIARDYEANLRFQGQLHRLARERAIEHAARGEWAQAAQFLAICERIWPGGYQVAGLHAETQNRLEEQRRFDAPLFDAPPPPGLPDQRPMNVTDALTLAQAALTEERYFDAHWLATMASRLASPNSPEDAAARRLSSLAWDGVNSLAPTMQETHAFYVFRLKRDGFEALNTQEWIRAYYIFLRLLELSPQDPDVHRFFAMSEEGLRQVAFFIDEMDMTMGNILTGAVFSLPFESGRVVMRFSSISVFPDAAYCMNAEILAFDRDGRLLWSMEAPYAKIFPLSFTPGTPGVPRQRLAVLLRSLDRLDESLRWEPVVESFAQSAPYSAQIALEVSWDNFVLLSDVRRGLSGLSIEELRRAAENLRFLGYAPEVFQVELLRRFTEPLLLLLLGVLAIALGWRYRALKHPRFLGFVMLGILPLVFNALVIFCRTWLGNLGILAVVSLGFTTAAFLFGAGLLLLFVVFLIMLASQHA